MMESIDYEARAKASEAKHGLNNHIQVTDIKIDNLRKELTSQITRLENFLKWAGGLVVSIFIAALAWSLTQQYNANESQKRDLQQQIQLLQAQQRAREVNSTITGATEPASPSTGIR